MRDATCRPLRDALALVRNAPLEATSAALVEILELNPGGEASEDEEEASEDEEEASGGEGTDPRLR